jgi:hypothetical protein
MPATPLSISMLRSAQLPAVGAELSYLAAGDGPVRVQLYPPNSGLGQLRPESVRERVTIRDARSIAAQLRLDESGFELRTSPSSFADFYDERAVKERYYPDVEAVLQAFTGAHAVIAFDHNVRSAARVARGEVGVREPADQVHNDYTEQSGPVRQRQILEAAQRLDLAARHFAFINLWRPLVGPVQDNPLTLADARSVAPADFVPTDIEHFGEDDLQVPRHRGQIYSVRYNPAHHWLYVSDMQPSEVLLLKCYDSRLDGRARFVPHTGFRNPACPPEFVPRESIEVRALVVFDVRR